MRLRLSMLKVNPSSAPRAAMASRFFWLCSGVAPYFSCRCSPMSWPSGPICGFSSKGWKCKSSATSPCSRSAACSSALRPMMHQGQETSETKSILSVVVMCGLSGCKTAIVGGLGAGRSMGGDDLCCPQGCAPPKTPRHQPLIARRSPRYATLTPALGPPPARTSLELTVERALP